MAPRRAGVLPYRWKDVATSVAPLSPSPRHREEACGKTTVFLHDPSTLRSPSKPACLRFNILVQQNNVREICADMRKANRSQITWVQPDVCRLFSGCVGSWPHLVKRGGLGVLHRVPVHERVRKTALFLRRNLSVFPMEVPARSTSPNMAKSRMALS